MGIVEAVSNFAVGFIEQNGYLAVFLLMALESACIPIPSEVVLPFSGFAVATGRLEFWPVVVVAWVGQLAGSVTAYFLGATEGRKLIERYGKYVLVRKHDIEVADRFFARHGEPAVSFSRVLPVVRTFISLPAGLAEMSFPRFIAYSAVGIFPWTLGLIFAGEKLGRHWEVVRQYLHWLDYLVLAALIVLIAKYVHSHLKGRRAAD